MVHSYRVSVAERRLSMEKSSKGFSYIGIQTYHESNTIDRLVRSSARLGVKKAHSYQYRPCTNVTERLHMQNLTKKCRKYLTV